MNAREALAIARGAVREAREAVRRGDQNRALELLRQFDHALVKLEQRLGRELAPVIAGAAALGKLSEAVSTIGALFERRRG